MFVSVLDGGDFFFNSLFPYTTGFCNFSFVLGLGSIPDCLFLWADSRKLLTPMVGAAKV